MKSIFSIFLSFIIAIILAACGGSDKPETDTSSDQSSSVTEESVPGDDNSETDTSSDQSSITEESTPDNDINNSESASEENDMSENIMYITANDTTFTAALADNSSAKVLVDLLKKGDITVNAHDYGDFEKVGSLPQSLPRNDEQITTGAGDLILYQGDQFVFYYDTNSWSFTRLGKVEGYTTEQLKTILGDGNVDLVLSLSK